MSSYRDMIGDWDRAVRAIEQRDWLSALSHLSRITDPGSKICFTLGCIHLRTGDLPGALKAFDQTIAKDDRLAICFFQRGAVHLRLEMLDEALGDFKHALNNLRGNSVIDYTQLGLRHRLHSWEVLYNLAAVYSRLGQWLEAQQSLEDAVQSRAQGSNTELERALDMVKRNNTFEPVDVPEGIVFKPRKHEVDELNMKDFLGTPKVISSVDPNDSFAGFKPLCPRKLGEQVVRGTRGYHYLLFDFTPKTASEVEAKAGNVVFVLENGEDGWSTVIANNQRGLIPTAYLEVWAGSRGNKQRQVPGNVSQTAPQAPASRPTGTEGAAHLKTVTSAARSGKDCLLPETVIIKVHYEYTVATWVQPGITYTDLLSNFKSKLGRQSGQIQLSYKDEEKQELVMIRGDEDLDRMWNQIVDRRLTLWCKVRMRSAAETDVNLQPIDKISSEFSISGAL
ncbi:neutrophil cytosol factor 2-like [Carcharodon carcharias]|uniref:neutrophil cytosol factor 2-like n=1 Tax=Carcharodon carcharias TaxID=13397 RepID=UPI001B7F56EE|nr:neutrophil cytosol factor 2-like [Carcharodon carcharias]